MSRTRPWFSKRIDRRRSLFWKLGRQSPSNLHLSAANQDEFSRSSESQRWIGKRDEKKLLWVFTRWKMGFFRVWRAWVEEHMRRSSDYRQGKWSRSLCYSVEEVLTRLNPVLNFQRFVKLEWNLLPVQEFWRRFSEFTRDFYFVKVLREL